jgi:hypothetical protein
VLWIRNYFFRIRIPFSVVFWIRILQKVSDPYGSGSTTLLHKRIALAVPEGGVLHIARNGSDHELLAGRPTGIRGGRAGLEPVLSLTVLVSQRHNRVVLERAKKNVSGVSDNSSAPQLNRLGDNKVEKRHVRLRR